MMNHASPRNTEARTILIVSNTPDEMGTLSHVLERNHLHAVVVADLAAGLKRATSGPVDLILLDIDAAGTDLADACRSLRTAGGKAPQPLLLMSPLAADVGRQRSVVVGASEHFTMPLNVHDVAAAIGQQLAPQRILTVNYHMLLASTTDPLVLIDIDKQGMVDANGAAGLLFGRSPLELPQWPLAALCPPHQPDGRPSTVAVQQLLAQVLAGAAGLAELTFEHSNGRRIDCELRLMLLPVPERRLVHTRLFDITARKQAQVLRDGQNAVLESIASGATLNAALTMLIELIERQSAGVYCTVLLLDDNNCMRGAAGPSLPADYLEAFDGLAIGPAVGSCGTAMYHKRAVVVSDIMTDPLWAPYRDFAHTYDLRACWSTPIIIDTKVLGSFAMYYREVRSPTQDEVHLIEVASHMAGIAIERSRREQELQAHREHLEELVLARTAELTLAKEQAELVSEELATALENLSITQDELVRRDKLAALGTLVAGIAHELNTPIGNSLVVASTMAERTQAIKAGLVGGLRRSELEHFLAEAGEADKIVLRNLERAAQLVSSFKQIAVDHTSAQRRQFNLAQLVNELLQPLQATLRHDDFRVVLDIDPTLTLDSYPGPLSQVVANLFENCVLHGFDGRSSGTITLGAAGTGDDVHLTISDNGVGISDANMRHIYNPFFTTKIGAGGSGLGLHIVHNIITGVLGGHIDASSDGHSGTSVRLTLPRCAPAAPAHSVPAADTP